MLEDDNVVNWTTAQKQNHFNMAVNTHETTLSKHHTPYQQSNQCLPESICEQLKLATKEDSVPPDLRPPNSTIVPILVESKDD